MLRPLVISIPAWGSDYVALAVKFTIPAVLASLARSSFTDVTFRIDTDQPGAFLAALVNHRVEFVPIPSATAARDHNWVVFKAAHRNAIAETPEGAICVLLNSDIVVSLETFPFLETAFDQGAKAVVSVGIRTLIDGNSPPIGVGADELNRWIWSHRHPITDEAIWQNGRSQHPTILFFEVDGAVTMHCFHLTPMFILKDRALNFKGTIDDDLLASYTDDEVLFAKNGEMAFAELSPRVKQHPFGRPLSVAGVVAFGKPKFSSAHKRNFSQRFKVVGDANRDHPAVFQIANGLGR